ncbi:XdhC family protein [Blastopirellula sp. JC732]|uniref:XdhC family protein n=1 Tax=Blastopirellula sediminis TaxID=2894196 RepID=A0A9X1MTT4_9BACT|nr:XdhC/CoxI family protein [Blastopirellula sediminis]MCC9605241.1 XdhC family protein [Blastopirellula sediminis]MCC9631459.1 XdhC family protein [Blastopirellula sediminis]
MRDLQRHFRQAISAGQQVVVCRLVETRGSTPQKPGAAMLIYPDGAQAGTLGGGCVEAEVRREALRILSQGTPELLTFQLDSDYGWDDGLICGGRMKVLLEPFGNDLATRDYYQRLFVVAEEGGTEAIRIDGESHELRLFDADGQLIASLRCDSDSDLAEISAGIEPLAQRPRPRVQNGIAYLPYAARCRLIIVGGGHVGKAVAALAQEADFDIVVCDDREEYVTEERFLTAQQRIVGKLDVTLPQIEIGVRDFCLIVTRGHNHDEEALFRLIDRGAAYLGMIGSRRKIRLIYDDLREQGISDESLAAVFAPVGVDIGSQTVPEIAISIVAQLISVRNLGAARTRELAELKLSHGSA